MQDRIDSARTPVEKAKWERMAYDLEEVGGASRFSPVTGTDSSDLPK